MLPPSGTLGLKRIKDQDIKKFERTKIVIPCKPDKIEEVVEIVKVSRE